MNGLNPTSAEGTLYRKEDDRVPIHLKMTLTIKEAAE